MVQSITIEAAGITSTITPEDFHEVTDTITGNARATIPGDGRFLGDFLDAPDLALIAGRLIATGDRFAFLRDWEASIAYAWKRKGGKKGGRSILGKCQTLSGYARFRAGKSYLIWAGADTCRAARLTGRQLEALAFHELCHLAPGEEDEETGEVGPPVVVGHDLEMFVAELEEYGAWRPDIEQAAPAFRQLHLDGLG